jgi:hypothetical protein
VEDRKNSDKEKAGSVAPLRRKATYLILTQNQVKRKNM